VTSIRQLLWFLPAAVFVVDGYIHGINSARWREPKELQVAIVRLHNIPMDIGDWRGTELGLNPRVAQVAGFSAYVHRRYENSRNGAVVTFMVACGPPGPLSVHTPDVCYQGSGYVQAGEVKKFMVDSIGHSSAFWASAFGKSTPIGPSQLRVCWSWNRGDGWTAADNPRFSFAGAPVLLKLYVTQGLAKEAEMPVGKDHCTDFLNVMLPVLEAK
jgi:hypothetical protein